MAATILKAIGFECGSTMLNAADQQGTVGVTTGHTGTYSLYLQQNTILDSWARWALSGTPANPSVSLWIKEPSYSATGYARLQFVMDTGLLIELRWNATTHTFDAYVNGGLVAAGTIEVSVNDWFHVQFYAVIADSGSIGVKIDSHQSITYSGDTKPGAETGATYFKAALNALPGPRNMQIDDLIMGYGDYIGALVVYDKMVDSDDTVAWTPSAGVDNYAMEDEIPPSDADYNEAAINALVDKLGLTALSLTGLTPVALISWTRAADPDAHGSSIKVGMDSGGTESVLQSALSAAFEYYWGNVEAVNPNGGGAWDQATVDAVLHMKEAVIP